jgi:hypothetical protein
MESGARSCPANKSCSLPGWSMAHHRTVTSMSMENLSHPMAVVDPPILVHPQVCVCVCVSPSRSRSAEVLTYVRDRVCAKGAHSPPPGASRTCGTTWPCVSPYPYPARLITVWLHSGIGFNCSNFSKSIFVFNCSARGGCEEVHN